MVAKGLERLGCAVRQTVNDVLDRHNFIEITVTIELNLLFLLALLHI